MKKLGKFVLLLRSQEKNGKKWKKSTKFTNHKIEKKKEKENTGTEVYMCAL
jgi:hypothetical protein